MNEHLPKQFYAPAANVVQDIFDTFWTVVGSCLFDGILTRLSPCLRFKRRLMGVYGASEQLVMSLLVTCWWFHESGHLVPAHLCTNVVYDYSVGPELLLSRTHPIGSKMTQLILNSIQPLSIAVVFLGMMVLYFVLPNVKIRKSALLLGLSLRLW